MASLARRAAGIVQATPGNLIPGNSKKAAKDPPRLQAKHTTLYYSIYDNTASSLFADTHTYTQYLLTMTFTLTA